MANSTDKFPENVPGRFFVDTECISCDTCAGLAGAHFTLTHDNNHAYVYVQPLTPQEIDNCQKALNACPVGAIGDSDNE